MYRYSRVKLLSSSLAAPFFIWLFGFFFFFEYWGGGKNRVWLEHFSILEIDVTKVIDEKRMKGRCGERRLECSHTLIALHGRIAQSALDPFVHQLTTIQGIRRKNKDRNTRTYHALKCSFWQK